MILKKPYGFLIKHFRIIHIILTALTIFIAVSSRNILSFIRRFISNGYTTTVFDNMASEYVNWTIYLAIVFVVISLIAVYILLRTKKKPNKIYLVAIIYYILLLIFVAIAAYLINSLSEGLWSTASARTYRDIAQIVYYPQFIFIIILGIRALGFNVKQFDFKSDLKELEITDEDSEEVELNINFETYKAERFIRRLIREFYYYYLENKRIVNVIFIVIVAITIFLAFKSYEKIRYTYDVGETFTYNRFSLNVTDSLLTNVNASGETIVEGRYYLVLKVDITNNSSNNATLDYNSLKIYVNGDYVDPSLDIGNHFLDYGDPFMGRNFSGRESGTYIIPYILTEDQLSDTYRLSIYTGSAQNSRNFMAITYNVNIRPTRLMDVEVVRETGLNDTVLFSSTYLGDSSLTIESAEIASRYEYTYQSCYRETCREYTGLVTTSTAGQLSQTLIIMDYDLILDEESDSYTNISNIDTFSDQFFSVEYLLYEEPTVAEAINVTPTRVTDKLILQTDKSIESASQVNLLITIRDRCYKIRIK